MKTITLVGKNLFLIPSNLIRSVLPVIFILSLFTTYSQSVENYFPEDGLITGGIYTIIQDQNQNLWFGSWTSDEGAPGLGKFDGTTWQTISTADGLVGDEVRVVFEDKSYNIWIGTTTGISKWDGTNFTNYTSADGLIGDYVYSINQDSFGNMWFGTQNGVSKFDGSNWTNYDTSTNPSLVNVSVILETHTGDLWFGTTGNGALKFDGSTWTNYDMSNGLGDDQVYAIIQDDNNDLWFGGYDRYGGISRFDGSTWTVYGTADGISNTQVRTIHLDNFGDIWFGHNAGVTRYDGSNWTNFDSEDGLIPGGVRAIMSDSNDNLWIGNWLSGVSNFKIGEVNIPDPNFEQALIEMGIDSDGMINGRVLPDDVKYIEVLDVPNKNISSLEGLWAFSNLKYLRAWDNQLTSLDVSSNPNLVHLSVARNQITGLDLTKNSALTELYAYENNLASLLIPTNDQLKHLAVSENQLTELDLSGSSALIDVYISNNDLSKVNLGSHPELVNIHAGGNSINALDVSNAPLLRSFLVWGSNLSEIDFSNNPLLEEIDLNLNNLSTLDVSNNPNLKFVFCNSNNLKSLNIANGNNADMVKPEWSEYTLDARSNPNLFCIEVDDAILENLPSDWQKDNHADYNADCSTFVPEASWGIVGSATPNGWNGPDIPMEYNEAINTWSVTTELSDGLIKFRLNNEWTFNLGDGEWENTVRDGIAEQDGADIPVTGGYYEISVDFDTYEYFIIPSVYIPDANFEQALIDLGIDSDGLINQRILRSDAETVSGSLDVSLKEISDLTGIEAFVNITELRVGDNNLIDLDLSRNSNLTLVDAVGNNIVSVDISNLNDISTLRLGGNVGVEIITNLPQVTSLKHLNLHMCELPTFDASRFPNLELLFLGANHLSSIDVTGLSELNKIFLQFNSLKNIDFSSNQKLTQVVLKDNQLEDLNIQNGNNESLEVLIATNNNLTCITADSAIKPTSANYTWDFDPGVLLSSDCGTLPEYVTIADPNFEQSLIDIGVDRDGTVNSLLLRSDAESVTDLNLTNPQFVTGRDLRYANTSIENVDEKIQDLTGIEAFVNLTDLSVMSNALTNVDISNNILLEDLNLVDNQISSIDVSKNTKLKVLWLETNELQDIDVSANTELVNLALGYNQLTNIDVTKNVKLKVLTIEGNDLTTVDLSQNTSMVQAWLAENPNLTHMDFSKNTEMYGLGIYNTAIKTLDLSNNPMTRLYFGNNPNLEHLDLRNGNNLNLNQFWADNTPNLTCINADAEISQAMIDSEKSFSIDCGDFIYIPDPNFEQSLIYLGIDSDGVVNTSILREDAEVVTDLNLNNPNFDNSNFANPELMDVTGKIADLTGIEAFINLKSLQVAYGALTEVDLSANTQLEELFLNDNQLNSVDISMLSNLKRFGIMRNNMTSGIDVSGNPLMEELFVHYTGISSIDLSANPNLWNLFIQNNELASLDLSANTALKRLSVQHNQLSDLDISMLSVIGRIDAQYNSNMTLLTGANGNPSLTSLNLSGTGLSNFNGAVYPNLEWLLLNDNNLSNFNGNNNLNLQHLFLNNNAITKLGLTGNSQLVQLQVMNNGMEELDLRNGNNSILGKMNVTGNLLTCISVDSPEDTTLPYSQWEMDLGVQLSINCKQAEEVVIIPDPAFEQALIELGYDTNGGDEITGNILLSEAEAVSVLQVSGRNITDATGIEAFVNLIEMDISNNDLAEINLLQNTNLEILNVSGNQLSELFIGNGKILTSLNASNNNLSSLNFADLTNLQTLDLSWNAFQALIFSDFGGLTSLDVSYNQLESLDLRNGNNSELGYMNASGNLLSCIGVDDAAIIPAGWSKDDETDYTVTGDCKAPIVHTRNITVSLDRYGLVEITSEDIDNGSYDNVTEQKNLIFNLSTSQFSCEDLGQNDVYLSVTDEAGMEGVNHDPAIVTVVDEIAPEVSALRSISLDLNGAASVALDPSTLDDGSTDNCGNLDFAVDQSIFSFPGNYTVEFTVSDASGNFSSAMVDVEVVDSQTNPTSMKFKGNIVATVYPNPFTDYFKIGFSEPVDINTVEAFVFDMQGGQTGLQFSVSGNELISDGNLSQQGTYILHVVLNGQTRTAEIIQN